MNTSRTKYLALEEFELKTLAMMLRISEDPHTEEFLEIQRSNLRKKVNELYYETPYSDGIDLGNYITKETHEERIDEVKAEMTGLKEDFGNKEEFLQLNGYYD